MEADHVESAADALSLLHSPRHSLRAAAAALLFRVVFDDCAVDIHTALSLRAPVASWLDLCETWKPGGELPPPHYTWPVALARILVHRELTPHLSCTACPYGVAEALSVAGSVQIDWLGDAVTLLVYRAVVDDPEEERAEAVAVLICAHLGDVDGEVLFRNAAGRRGARAAQASRMVAQRLHRARRMLGLPSAPYDKPDMSLRARLAYVEPHERNAELRSFLLLSHSLSALSLLTDEDIRIIGLMVQHYGSGGSSGECIKDSPEEDVFIAVRALTNWLLAVLQPFSNKDPSIAVAVDPDSLEELLRGLVHLTTRPRAHTGREDVLLAEVLYLLNVLSAHKGLRHEAGQALDLTAVSRIAHTDTPLADAAWELLAHVSQERGVASALIEPGHMVLATIAAALRKEQLYGKVRTAHAAAAATHITVHGPVYRQELLQSRQLADALDVCFKKLSPKQHPYMLCANVASLAARLVAHMNVLLAKSAIEFCVRALIELSEVQADPSLRRQLGPDQRDGKLEAALCQCVAVGLDATVDNIDRRREGSVLRQHLTTLPAGMDAIRAAASLLPTWVAGDARLACLGMLATTAPHFTPEVAAAVASDALVSLAALIEYAPRALSLVSRVVVGAVPLLQPAGAEWWAAAAAYPPLLDAALVAMSDAPPAPASGLRDTLVSALEAVCMYTAQSDCYCAAYLWRACGLSSGVGLPELLLGGHSQGLHASRKAAAAPLSFHILADVCNRLPSAARGVAIEEGTIAAAVAAASDAAAAPTADRTRCQAMRLLAAVAMYDAASARAFAGNAELCAAVARARAPLTDGADQTARLTAAAAASLSMNVSVWTSGCADEGLLSKPDAAPAVDRGAVSDNVARLSAASEAEEKALARFEREFGGRFGEARKRRAERESKQAEPQLRRRRQTGGGLAENAFVRREPLVDAEEWRRLRDKLEGRWEDGDDVRNVCAFCTKRRGPDQPPMRACTGCYSVAYCSADCQRMHWTSQSLTPPHKLHCATRAEARSAGLSRRRRTLLSDLTQIAVLCSSLWWLLSWVFCTR